MTGCNTKRAKQTKDSSEKCTTNMQASQQITYLAISSDESLAVARVDSVLAEGAKLGSLEKQMKQENKLENVHMNNARPQLPHYQSIELQATKK